MTDAENMTDAEKLRALADWFDVRDAKEGRTGTEVQDDLRRIAMALEESHMVPAPCS